ncbi:MAG: TetR/AcrR family transcriptional regulator [Actinomycetota bacterium]|nr:TetR/AcrR family transcriptional regulator [Actinomycetota bacterium]
MQELRTAPRQRRSQQSIDSILDAAERLIHDQGQVSFTANELAMAANMSIGRVYYWFPDMPSVVNALAERAAERLATLFQGLLKYDDSAPTPLVLAETVSTLCRHIDENPSTVALCLSGSGELDYGATMRESIVAVAVTLLRKRVPGIPDAEVELVSRTAVGIAMGMLHAYLQGSPAHRPHIQQELVYVLSAWLYSRYPRANDAAWSDPQYPIQPSRMPVDTIPMVPPAYPALAPNANPVGTN